MAGTGLADDSELRHVAEAIVTAGRRLGARGLIAAGEGNLSVRLADGRVLITPTGLRKDELEIDDLVAVDLDVRDGAAQAPHARGRRPTSDMAIHRAIRVARADAVAVAHAHAPATLALTLAGERPNPADLPETALLLPRLPFVSFGTPGSSELADRIAAAFAERPEPLATAVVLERHGAVAVGTHSDPAAAIAQAVDRLELVEVLCRATGEALLLRAARATIDSRG
jgi:L-fuculose-phosphate aldolase